MRKFIVKTEQDRLRELQEQEDRSWSNKLNPWEFAAWLNGPQIWNLKPDYVELDEN